MTPDLAPHEAPQEAMLAELDALRRILATAQKPDAPANDDGLVVMRLSPELGLDEWEALCRRQDLRDWLALPLSANPLPFLTRIQATLRELTFLSEHDPLTKLDNREAFERVLTAELSRSARIGQSLALVIFEIDDFNLINADHKPSCSDHALESVAALLLAEKRTFDHAARLGGEKFALLLPSVGLVRSQLLVERILAAARSLSISCDCGNAPIHVTLSAGLACTKGKMATTREKLFALADDSLRRAKEEGKDRFVAAPIADLTGPPEKTLVRADEKRFLFTGLTKG